MYEKSCGTGGTRLYNLRCHVRTAVWSIGELVVGVAVGSLAPEVVQSLYWSSSIIPLHTFCTAKNTTTVMILFAEMTTGEAHSQCWSTNPRMSFSLVVSMVVHITIKCFTHSSLESIQHHNIQITQYFTTSKYVLLHSHRPSFIQISLEAVVVHGRCTLWL
jgi:hypothetical protein